MSKRDRKYKKVESVVGQYIRGGIRAEDLHSKYKKGRNRLPAFSEYDGIEVRDGRNNCGINFSTVGIADRTPNSYTTCDECDDRSAKAAPDGGGNRVTRKGKAKKAPGAACSSLSMDSDGARDRNRESGPKPEVEIGDPNLSSELPAFNVEGETSPESISPRSGHGKSALRRELRDLRHTSDANQRKIDQLLKRLNGLKLSITLLREEQQRLEHCKQIRSVNTNLLINMLRGRAENEGSLGPKARQRFEKERRIVQKLFDRFGELEEMKMKLEYENTRNLYAIKELKKENAQLAKIKIELSKELNLISDEL